MHAARAIIYDFDSRFVRLFEHDILRLEVTVHYAKLLLKLECLENLDCESAH